MCFLTELPLEKSDGSLARDALLRLLEIKITHSRNVEVVIMMRNCGIEGK